MEIKLDKSKVYSLEDLTRDQFRKLYGWLLENDNGWQYVSFEHWKNNKESLKYSGSSWAMYPVEPTTNAKELFYTLKNVQIDCRKLSKKQIENIEEVFENNDYSVGIINLINSHYFFRYNGENYVFVGKDRTDDGFHTITYEKFMELFGTKVVTESEYYINKSTHGVHLYEKLETLKVKNEHHGWRDYVRYRQTGSDTIWAKPLEMFEKEFKKVDIE